MEQNIFYAENSKLSYISVIQNAFYNLKPHQS